MKPPLDSPNNPLTPEQKTNSALGVLSDHDAIDKYYDRLIKDCAEGIVLPTMSKENLDIYVGDDPILRALVDATYDLDPKVLGIVCDVEKPVLEDTAGQEFVRIEGPYVGPDGKERKQAPKYVPRHVFDAYSAMNDVYREWLSSQSREGLPARPGLLIKSGYRSPAYQAILALRTIKENGLEATLRSLLPPGYSQHGQIAECAIDILMMGNDYGKPERENGSPMEIDETIEGAWMLQNMENYGFWLPFYPDPDNPTSPTGKTGIIIEPWHLQFVGVPKAAELMAQHNVRGIFAARHAAFGVSSPIQAS